MFVLSVSRGFSISVSHFVSICFCFFYFNFFYSFRSVWVSLFHARSTSNVNKTTKIQHWALHVSVWPMSVCVCFIRFLFRSCQRRCVMFDYYLFRWLLWVIFLFFLLCFKFFVHTLLPMFHRWHSFYFIFFLLLASHTKRTSVCSMVSPKQQRLSDSSVLCCISRIVLFPCVVYFFWFCFLSFDERHQHVVEIDDAQLYDIRLIYLRQTDSDTEFSFLVFGWFIRVFWKFSRSSVR